MTGGGKRYNIVFHVASILQFRHKLAVCGTDGILLRFFGLPAGPAPDLCSDQPVVQHGVYHLDEAPNIGAHQVVVWLTIFFGRI